MKMLNVKWNKGMKKTVVCTVLVTSMMTAAVVPGLSNTFLSPIRPIEVSAQSGFTWNEQAVDKTMYLTDPCHRRQQPTTASLSYGVLPAGTAVHVVATTDAGFNKLADGTFVCADYLVDAPAVETSVHNSSIQAIINSSELNPHPTGFANVDSKIQEVFAQIGVNDLPDTYSKVKAIYDYLINTTSYGTNVYPSAGYGNVSEGSQGYIAWNTMALLDRHIGPCNKYSSAFIAMVETIGLDAGYIDGMCSRAGGGMMGHVWVEVYINGTTYVFDPQVEDNMTSGGNIRYDRFCKTYSQLGGKYSSANRLG